MDKSFLKKIQQKFMHSGKTPEDFESQKIKVALERLHKFPLIGNQGMVSILLVLKDLKPISEFDWAVGKDLYDQSSEKQREIDEYVNSMKLILSDLGLVYDFTQEPWGSEEYSYESFSFCVARTPEMVKEYKAILNNEGLSTKEHQVKLAQLFGYPQTASTAFSNGEQALVNDISDIPTEELDGELRKFIEKTHIFKFSKEYYKDELKTYAQWAQAIKEIDLEFYNFLIK
jgi:hypothetical protein